MHKSSHLNRVLISSVSFEVLSLVDLQMREVKAEGTHWSQQVSKIMTLVEVIGGQYVWKSRRTAELLPSRACQLLKHSSESHWSHQIITHRFFSLKKKEESDQATENKHLLMLVNSLQVCGSVTLWGHLHNLGPLFFLNRGVTVKQYNSVKFWLIRFDSSYDE